MGDRVPDREDGLPDRGIGYQKGGGVPDRDGVPDRALASTPHPI